MHSPIRKSEDSQVPATAGRSATTSPNTPAADEENATTFAIELGKLIGRCLAEKLPGSSDRKPAENFPSQIQSTGSI